MQSDNKEGDFFHAGHRYNIHDLHRIIDSNPGRHNAAAPPNRGMNAFSRSDGMSYGPHDAPPPRLGPNGRPMVRQRHFGIRSNWVEMPEYRGPSSEQCERDMAEQIEFIEKHPDGLGPTWNPSRKRW
jgi:hypothetical protein